jgi:hypothetical protein
MALIVPEDLVPRVIRALENDGIRYDLAIESAPSSDYIVFI